MRCNRFDGFPCLTDGKADAHVRCVRPALAHDNVTLRTHAKVERLETDSSGNSVNRVVVDRRGTREIYSADIVVVSCGATNSAALLLRSAQRRAPAGLGELLRRRRPPLHGAHQLRCDRDLADAEHDEVPEDPRHQRLLLECPEDSELPLGHIQMLGKSDKDILRAGAPWFAPGLALDYMAKHAIDFWLTTEDLPHPSNRVTVDRGGQIRVAKTYHNLEPHKRLLGKLKAADGAAGLPRLGDPFLVDPRSADPAGRQRAPVRHGPVRDRPERARPSTSNCRAHDVDNLYVVDTSFFPSSSRREPGADGDGERAARRRSPARTAGCHSAGRRGSAKERQASGGSRMKTAEKVASSIGKGLVAGFAGTAAMTVSSTLEAKLRGRSPSTAPARATAKVLGIAEFEDAIAQARWNDVSHWGYGTGWGIVRGLLDAAGLPPAKATAAHGAAIWGSAQVTLPALEIAPPIVFWPRQEIAIDAFHHTVYAIATGVAYELISSSNGHRH